jgi:hypothetical protein
MGNVMDKKNNETKDAFAVGFLSTAGAALFWLIVAIALSVIAATVAPKSVTARTQSLTSSGCGCS